MTVRTSSLGSLLQGVSQQPDRVRLPGQVSEQINLHSDVTRGLSSRPATEEGPTLAMATPELTYDRIKFDGVEYILGYGPGEVHFWGLDGTHYPVVENSGGELDYVGSDMRFHVVADPDDENKRVIVLSSRDTIVERDDTLVGWDWHVGLFHALGGAFLKTYRVEVEFEDGTIIDAEYTAPDGTGAGDASQTTSDVIIKRLVTDLFDHPDKPVGTKVQENYDVGRIFHPTMRMNLTVSDGDGGTILRGASDTVKTVSDLPRFAPHGTIVKVVTSAADEDDYWLKFEAKDTTIADGTEGFGKEGTWVEWYNPDEPRSFDLTTMPHMIRVDGANFVLHQGPWIGRAVGDSGSSPFPSIIGKPIRDINSFESRLLLLTNNTLVGTRTNHPFDLWRESATETSATDPLDLTSTKKDDLRFDWLVPFDRDMFIVSDPGDSQFVIRGGGVTPTNSSMVLTTEFEIASGGTPPVSTGRTILFPFQTGAYSGIKEFYTDSDSAANAANSLTEALERYIVGPVDHMVVSQNFNLGLFKSTGDSKSVYVYKYLWDTNEILQSSWSKWQFQDDVLFFFFSNSLLTFLSVDDDGDVFLHTLDLNAPQSEYGFHIMLDRKTVKTVSSGGYVELNYSGAKFMQSTGCLNPGLDLVPDSEVRIDSTTHRYYLPSTRAPVNAEVVAGQVVECSVTPSTVLSKDYQGRVDSRREVSVMAYVLHLEDSGDVLVTGTSPYRDYWETSTFTYDLTSMQIETDGTLLLSGTYEVPWGELASAATMTLKSNGLRPMRLLELEWVGEVLSARGQR